MNIKQSIRRALALAMVSAIPSSWADIMYFQIQDAAFSEQSGKSGDATFSYATVRTDGSENEYLHVYDESGATEYWKIYAQEDQLSTTPTNVGEFDSDSVSYFMVELWDDSENRVGWQRYGVSSLLSFIWRDGMPGGGATALTVQQIIPEPTSGLLLLVGGALLALRRRRFPGRG